MKEKQDSTQQRPRRLHGCLPLFVVGSAVVVGSALWWIPVQMKTPVRSAGMGRVYYHNSGLVNYEAARKSPLTLLTELDPGGFFYNESEEMYASIGRNAELRKAPPLDILPLVADSVVISREILLELPPETGESLPADGEAALPSGEQPQQTDGKEKDR